MLVTLVFLVALAASANGKTYCSGARDSFRLWLLLGYFPSVHKRRQVMLLGVLLQCRSPNSTPRTNTTPRGPTVPLAS